ncbi:hypothetical protein DKX38_013938 [Salix brachista]|uniref:Uncharacterized protein n=1 Tax=Salix brachista TaxID=2182728 RepID=A0A5N5LDW8_9ROSI|nr:hypothetical protein DKX38_013938 [Salix brachista]
MVIALSGNNICEMLQSWWTQTSIYKARGMIRLMLPCLVCWEDWEDRRVSEGTGFNLLGNCNRGFMHHIAFDEIGRMFLGGSGNEDDCFMSSLMTSAAPSIWFLPAFEWWMTHLVTVLTW